MKVAVAGGTGVVGRWTVSALRQVGNEPVVLARSTGVDLVSDGAPHAGLAAALAGCDAVIDVSNIAGTKAAPVSAFFEAVSRNLMREAAAAGVGHIVALSIIGIDRVPYGYYKGKLRQEAVLAESPVPVPVSILRAAQFHEFPGQYLTRFSGRFVIVPRWRVQPVAAREVGAELARLAGGAPPSAAAPVLSELAGPAEENMADLIRQVIRARATGGGTATDGDIATDGGTVTGRGTAAGGSGRGARRRVIEVRLPGAAGKAMAAGGNLPGPDVPRGSQTFAGWLAAQQREGNQP
jgi:uncharacterized protein YbjT (DUF2867 family)